jgi:hypothetical protein
VANVWPLSKHFNCSFRLPSTVIKPFVFWVFRAAAIWVACGDMDRTKSLDERGQGDSFHLQDSSIEIMQWGQGLGLQ